MVGQKEVRENLRRRGLNSRTVGINPIFGISRGKTRRFYQLIDTRTFGVLSGNFRTLADARIAKRRFLLGLPIFKGGKLIRR